MSKLPPEVGFVLFKPDMFHRQLFVPIFQFLKEQGFVPLSFLASRVSDAQYKLMYSNNFLWEVDDWYHNRQIYSFGPGLGVLFRNNIGNTQEIFSQIKGAALPKERRVGSLRQKFSSKSRIFNLIHVPDNIYQAEKEVNLWFGGIPSFDEVKFEEMVNELECFNFFETYFRLDPEEMFTIAKLRLLHACKKSRSCPEQLNKFLMEATHFYRRWKKTIVTETSGAEIEGTLLPKFQEEEEILCKQIIKACEIDKSRKQLIEVLLASSNSKHISNFFWILDEWNVYLSELEKYLILSRLKYNSSFAKDFFPRQSKIELERNFQ